MMAQAGATFRILGTRPVKSPEAPSDIKISFATAKLVLKINENIKIITILDTLNIDCRVLK